MPLPSDDQLVKTAHDVVSQFRDIFGNHAGYRPAHAKGIMLSGVFTPSSEAGKLSDAPHFTNATTPVTVRFSNSTGIPAIPDNDSNADPRGMGIRFNLGDHVHTDVIAHSTPFFPARTGAEFLEFLRSIAGGTVEAFLGGHPAALAFVQAPKPAPSSYGREQYYSVTAFKLVSASGQGTFIRYHVVPDSGVDTLDAEALKGKDPDYLQHEISKRVQTGPIGFRLLAQVAEEGDVVNDSTIHWPESRKVVELGRIELESVIPDNAKEQKRIIYDPIPRVKGVEATDDPLLEMRAAIYLIGGRERRAAP